MYKSELINYENGRYVYFSVFTCTTYVVTRISFPDSILYFVVLVFDFRCFLVESYYNQTYKMISAINFISDFCPNASLILRIDDDVLFHPQIVLPRVLSFMNVSNPHDLATRTLKRIPRNTIVCRLISDFSVWRKKDHPKHFNAVDETVLPGETMYPPFCAGFFIAMSGDVPTHLQRHIAANKPFWMDDRYMGVLQKSGAVHNIDITESLDFGYESIKRSSIEQIISSQIVAKHLPGKFKLHLTELFEFIDLAHHGLRGYFTEIPYNKKKKQK